ncbi:MAG: hypothetical protein WAM83_07255, partial [Bradyrhizobium sp.]
FEPALFRAKCLRIRLVKGLVLDKQRWGKADSRPRFSLRPIRSKGVWSELHVDKAYDARTPGIFKPLEP